MPKFTNSIRKFKNYEDNLETATYSISTVNFFPLRPSLEIWKMPNANNTLKIAFIFR